MRRSGVRRRSAACFRLCIDFASSAICGRRDPAIRAVDTSGIGSVDCEEGADADSVARGGRGAPRSYRCPGRTSIRVCANVKRDIKKMNGPDDESPCQRVARAQNPNDGWRPGSLSR